MANFWDNDTPDTATLPEPPPQDFWKNDIPEAPAAPVEDYWQNDTPEDPAAPVEDYWQNAAPKDKPFFDLADTASALVDFGRGIVKTTPSAVRTLWEGLERPDKWSPDTIKALEADEAFQREMQAKTEKNRAAGTSSSVGESIREAGSSAGFSFGSMAAALPAAAAGAYLTRSPLGTNLAGGLAGGTAAYRMAGARFLNDSFKDWQTQEEQRLGRPVTEPEKEAAYQELLPLAQNAGLWEAGPEAIGNMATLGAGKVILGLGKNRITDLAKGSLAKLGVKAGAAAGAIGTELATETVTQVGQGLPQAQAEAIAANQDPALAQSAYPVTVEGVTQAFKDVAPQTLALSGLMMGAAGGVRLATRPFRNQPEADPAATPPPLPTPPAPGTPPSAITPLVNLARQAGSQDRIRLTPEEAAAGLTDPGTVEGDLLTDARFRPPFQAQPPGPMDPGMFGNVTEGLNTLPTNDLTQPDVTALMPQIGGPVSYEGYQGRLGRDTEGRLVVDTGAALVEVADPRGLSRLPDASFALPAVPPQAAPSVPAPQPGNVNAAPAGTGFVAAPGDQVALVDELGKVYVPQNRRLDRTVRVAPDGEVEVLVQRVDQPGRIFRLRGAQAQQAQTALLDAVIAQESQARGLRPPTPGTVNRQGSALPFEEIVGMAAAAIRSGVTNFSAWATAMIRRFGQAISQYLAGAWQAAVKTSEVGALNVIVAPLRRDALGDLDRTEMLKRADSAKFIHLQQVVNDVAEAFGVPIISRQPIIGGWTEDGQVSLEVPESIQFDTDDLDLAENLAALISISAPELQNAGLVWRDDEAGLDTKVTFQASNARTAMEVAQDLNSAGVQGFSYDPQTRQFSLVLVGLSGDGVAKVHEYIQSKTLDGSVSTRGGIETRPGTARFAEQSNYRRHLDDLGRQASAFGPERAEAIRDVVSRAERRLDRYNAAQVIAAKAQGVLAKKRLPKMAAAFIERTLKGRQFDNIRQFGLWLDQHFERATGMSAFPVGSQEGVDHAATAFVYDLLEGLAGDGSGMGWYDERVQETIRELIKMHPEFAADVNALTVYIGALAATSQGYTVTQNFKHAERVYAAYKITGRMPTDLKFAAADALINGNLAFIQSVIDNYGLDGYREFMDKEVTGSALRDMFGKPPTGVTLTDVVRGNRMMGPKIGSFFNNLRGRFDTITMDLWYTRTMHRYLGESLVPLNTDKMQKAIATFRTELAKPETRTYGLDLEAALQGDEASVQAALTLFQRWARGKTAYSEKGYQKFADGYKIEKAARRIFSIGTMKGAPQNKAYRTYFARVVRQTKKKMAQLGFDLTEADIQAIIWYREKNLFARLGIANGASKPADYLDAAMGQRMGVEAQDEETDLGDVTDEEAGADEDASPGGFTNTQVVATRPDGSTVIFAELVDLGARAVQAGVSFAQWTADMIRRFGAGVRQYLQGAWQAASKNSRKGFLHPGDLPAVITNRLGLQRNAPFRVKQLGARDLLMGSTLPAEMVPLVAKSENEVKALEQAAAQLARDLQAAETAAVERRGLPLDRLHGHVTDFLNGVPVAGPILSAMDPVTYDRARRMRNFIDDLTATVATSLPAGTMRNTLINNTGSWLRRSYAAFDPNSGWNFDNLMGAAKRKQEVGGRLALDVLRKGAAYLSAQNGYPASMRTAQGLPVAGSDLEADMRNLMDRDQFERALTGQPGASKNVTSLMRRKDIPQQIRELMGEETNVFKRFVASASFQAQFIRRHHAQVAMRQVGLASGLFSATRGGVYTQEIPTDGPRWSGLAGMWTTPELWEALQRSTGVSAAGTDLAGYLGRFLRFTSAKAKLNRVALNPDSWMVNGLGGATMMLMNGDWFSGRVAARLMEAVRLMKSGAAKSGDVVNAAQDTLKDIQRDLIARLTAEGVFGAGITVADIEASLPRHTLQWIETDLMRDRLYGAGEGALIGQGIGRGFGTTARVVGGAVGAAVGGAVGTKKIRTVQNAIADMALTKPDMLFRLTGFLTNYEAALGAGLAPDAAFTEASTRTLNTFPNYAAVPAFLRSLSQFGAINSFVSFMFEMYRNTAWSMRYMAEDLAAPSMAQKRRGLQRLAGAGAVGGLMAGGLPALISLLFGGGDDKDKVGMDDERNNIFTRWFAAPWERDAILAFTKFDKQGVSYLNTSYLLPQQILGELAMAARNGDNPTDAAARIAVRLQTQFAGDSVNLAPLMQAYTNTDGRGRPVTVRSGIEGAWERTDHALKVIAEPGFVDKVNRLIYAHREAERRGRTFSVEQEFRRVIGLRETTRTWDDLALGRYKEFDNQIGRIREGANRTLGENLPGAKATALERANRELAEVRTELQRFEKEAVKLGVPFGILQRAKKDTGLSNVRNVMVDPIKGNRVKSIGTR